MGRMMCYGRHINLGSYTWLFIRALFYLMVYCRTHHTVWICIITKHVNWFQNVQHNWKFINLFLSMSMNSSVLIKYVYGKICTHHKKLVKQLQVYWCQINKIFVSELIMGQYLFLIRKKEYSLLSRKHINLILFVLQ